MSGQAENIKHHAAMLASIVTGSNAMRGEQVDVAPAATDPGYAGHVARRVARSHEIRQVPRLKNTGKRPPAQILPPDDDGFEDF
jgi:hypothetical protein